MVFEIGQILEYFTQNLWERKGPTITKEEVQTNVSGDGSCSIIYIFDERWYLVSHGP